MILPINSECWSVSTKTTVIKTHDLAPVEGERETILVVEDDPVTRFAICEILEMLGYVTLAARDGIEALGVYRQRPGEIALVICDMVMPMLGGPGLYLKLREIKPDVRVVVMTGYSMAEKKEALLDLGVYALIQKPFFAEQFSKIVHEALAA